MVKQVLRRISVTAVHQNELEPVLHRLGVYDEVVAGRAKCHFCNVSVTMENIGGLLSLNGKIVLVCDKPECLAKAALASVKK